MSDIGTFRPSAISSRESDDSNEINVGQLERMASIAAGAGILLGLARYGSLARLLGALFGAALIHRGITGHCQVYEAMDDSCACDYEEENEYSHQVDIASDDSFPASDPPAWTGAAAT